MEQNDFMTAMRQSSPEASNAMEENKANAEKTANVVATITILFGCLALLIGIISSFVFYLDFNETAAWISFAIGFAVFFFGIAHFRLARHQ